MFSFTRYISTPCIFDFSGLLAVSYLDTRSRDPLLSWGSFRGFWRFRRRLWSGQQIFLSFPHELAWVPSDILGVSTLVVGSDILGDLRSALVVVSSTFRPLVWQRFLWALDPKVLSDSRGFPKLSEGMLRDYERRPGKLLPAFCCSCLNTKKV